MSDPYGHGETCECDRCIAWSEGFETAKQHARVPFLLHRVTHTLQTNWPALHRALPSTSAAAVLGLVSGALPEREARDLLVSLDTLCRLAPHAEPHGGGQNALGRVSAALVEAGLHALPPPKPRAQPTCRADKAAILLRAGWVLAPAGTELAPASPRRRPLPGATPREVSDVDLYYRPHAPHYERNVDARTLDRAWEAFRREERNA